MSGYNSPSEVGVRNVLESSCLDHGSELVLLGELANALHQILFVHMFTCAEVRVNVRIEVIAEARFTSFFEAERAANNKSANENDAFPWIHH